MSLGLAALLDDIAAMARAAAASIDDIAVGATKASAKAVGVVIDDTAVTPQYVRGIKPARELPIIKRITIGSLINKIVIITPIALLASQFLPWILTPLLMVGGCYLSFEGAEKFLGWFTGKGGHQTPAAVQGEDAEDTMVRSAITTDFILSAEIMVISLNEVTEFPLLQRAAILVVVALVITFLVYGVVAIIVKMDDVGLHFARSDSPRIARFGRGLVQAMPRVLKILTVIGTLAMLWVGGHILLVGTADLGWTGPHALVHHLEQMVGSGEAVGGLIGFARWGINTVCSFIIGVVVGSVLAGIIHLLPFGPAHGQGIGLADAERA